MHAAWRCAATVRRTQDAFVKFEERWWKLVHLFCGVIWTSVSHKFDHGLTETHQVFIMDFIIKNRKNNHACLWGLVLLPLSSSVFIFIVFIAWETPTVKISSRVRIKMAVRLRVATVYWCKRCLKLSNSNIQAIVRICVSYSCHFITSFRLSFINDHLHVHTDLHTNLMICKELFSVFCFCLFTFRIKLFHHQPFDEVLSYYHVYCSAYRSTYQNKCFQGFLIYVLNRSIKMVERL